MCLVLVDLRCCVIDAGASREKAPTGGPPTQAGVIAAHASMTTSSFALILILSLRPGAQADLAAGGGDEAQDSDVQDSVSSSAQDQDDSQSQAESVASDSTDIQVCLADLLRLIEDTTLPLRHRPCVISSNTIAKCAAKLKPYCLHDNPVLRFRMYTRLFLQLALS